MGDTFATRWSFVILVQAILITNGLSAQEKQGTNTDALQYRELQLPEFYQAVPVKKGDTMFAFESYVGQKTVNVDTMPGIGSIDKVRYLKSYYPFRRKPNSAYSAPYVSDLLHVYERTGIHTWVGIDPVSGVKTDLAEDTKKIVRCDTANSITIRDGHREVIIHKYYKVTDVGPSHYSH